MASTLTPVARRPGLFGIPLPPRLLLLMALVPCVAASATGVKSLSLAELDRQLQTCPIVKDLNAAIGAHGDHHHHGSASSSFTARIFGMLFPSAHPAVNALLATAYISGPPNLLLALCPTRIDPSSLAVMVAFAVGGLLGDTLFHLLPEIFLGEHGDGKARFVLVEPNRNLILGLAIMIGFMAFVALDKLLRIATGGGSGHSHHDHDHHGNNANVDADADAGAAAQATGAQTLDKTGSLAARPKRQAKAEKHGTAAGTEGLQPTAAMEAKPRIRLSGYLNLIADFTHNITDGLAMSASFYASPAIGATTTVAVFFHEIPHEVGDFALLIQSGFTKRAAMWSQFVTALGALLGTLIGIAVQELGGGGSGPAGAGATMPRDAGIWGTSLRWGDMLLPFTAGTFLYVGTVAVIPELLETGPNAMREMGRMAVQFAAVAVGAGVMLYISWHD